jgi:site-specific recombinase XerD
MERRPSDAALIGLRDRALIGTSFLHLYTPPCRKRYREVESPKQSLVGLRDRALIATMVYSFARINGVLKMKVRDYFVQGRRGWVHLHEKAGKEHEIPCHHNMETYLDDYWVGVEKLRRRQECWPRFIALLRRMGIEYQVS